VVLVSAVQLVPDWARQPRNEAGSPERLILHPLNQKWESIGSDSFDRDMGLLKVALLLAEHDAVLIQMPIEVDPAGEVLAFVGWLCGAAAGNGCQACAGYEEQEQARSPSFAPSCLSLSRWC
jgi:hypothetical protein